MNNLISIVLPVYNGAKFLKESIDSIIAQTYTNWELLILDDCSTDQTPNIAKDYVSKDNRIKYYRNENNLKLPNNLNKGFSLAQGDYLTWTSDDNKYHPTALEKMFNTLNNSTAHFVFASCRIIDENGTEIEYIIAPEKPMNKIVGSNCVGACFLYTRKVYEEVGNYDDNFVLVEDFDYWQRAFAKFNVVAIREILYDYRFHSGALTSTMKQELFNTNLEKMLLKNRKNFGVLNYEQSFNYYFALNKCRKKLAVYNADKFKHYYYSIWYFLFKRIPNKIKRTIEHLRQR